MENTQKISVIMSCLNTPNKMLETAVSSVLRQNYPNIEFIIVNNGGNNFDQLCHYSDMDKRIILINHDHIMDLPSSLNDALSRCTGDFVARMDSDDICMPNRFLTQINFLNENSKCAACGMYAKLFGSKDEFAVTPWISPDEVKASLFFSNELFHPTIMLRRSFLVNNNLNYNKEYNYSEDFKLWTDITLFGEMAIIPEIGICYRMHNNKASVSGKSIQYEAKRKVLLDNLARLGMGEEDIDCLLALSDSSIQVDDNKQKEFINRILNNNNRKNIYNQKTLEYILYNAYCRKLIKERKYSTLLKDLHVMFKSRLWVYMFQKRKHISRCKSQFLMDIKENQLILESVSSKL